VQWLRFGVQFEPWPRRVRLLKSNYLKIIPMHMMIRDKIPAGNRGFDGVLYKLTVADTLISSIKVLATLT